MKSYTIRTKMWTFIMLSYHLYTIGMNNENAHAILNDDSWVYIFNELSPENQLNLASCCKHLHTLYSTRSTITSPIIHTEESFLRRVKNLFLEVLHPKNKNVNALTHITQKIQTNQITGTLTIKSKKTNVIDSIFQSLETNNTITTLDLSSCHFTHDHVPTFINSYACKKSFLKKIVLINESEDNFIDCLDVYLILKSVPALEEFSYNNNSRYISFAFSHALQKRLNNKQLEPLGEQLMQLKKLRLRNIFLGIFGLQWLTDTLKKNTRLEELDLQGNYLFLTLHGLDWNMCNIREAADQPDNSLRILDIRNPDHKDTTIMDHIPPYQPKRPTLTILL